MTVDPTAWLSDALADLDARGLRRRLRLVQPSDAPEIRVDGRPAVNFSSNGYLGLSSAPEIIRAAASALVADGAGAPAARLIAGNHPRHAELEQRIATFKQTEAALLFPTGYHANLGTIAALVGPDDVVFSDQLNHASIIDGCRLSRATVEVYPHRDIHSLDTLLTKHAGAGRRRLIVTESVFSMDGDFAPLAEIAELATQHSAMWMVDEAHATGVIGPDGRGLAAQLELVPTVQMGTLGKAFGVSGAYVAGSRTLIDWLVNRARTFIFTTATPPALSAAASAALALAASAVGEERRRRLMFHVETFHAGLRQLGLGPIRPSHIIPLRVGEAHATMVAADHLLAAGIFAQGIRPPTVPAGTGRLRFSLMATHTDQHIQQALEAIRTNRGLFAASASSSRTLP